MTSLKTTQRQIIPVEKTLLFDLSRLKIGIDNIEGLTWGSPLPGGERSLILISDNNFKDLQTTQIIGLRLNHLPKSLNCPDCCCSSGSL